MKSGFCTICTFDYFYKVKTLYDSINQFDTTKELHVLVTDKKIEKGSRYADCIFLYDISELSEVLHAAEIISKYGPNSDTLRWALKPVFASYLLQSRFDKIILLDSDIYFFQPYQFLFDDLGKHRVLLTPHWRCKNPNEDEFVFINNLTDGVFNAGFFAATKDALDILEWWAMVCEFKCEKNYQKGLWDDQKYLDLLPGRFPGVGIVWHQGCNVAWWNKHDSARIRTGNETLINGKYPIVFIHFTEDTLADINPQIKNNDPLLIPYLEKYDSALKKNKTTAFLHA
jgi:hypothetical protein